MSVPGLHMVCFGQAVVGPPGSGKTTYCHGMASFLRASGRDAVIVNLDPANDKLPFKADLDIFELISVQEAMETYGLGPNGGLMYCMEYIEKNLDWLFEKLEALGKAKYFLFDFPGQVELYTHGDAARNILQALQKWGCRLTAVHLVDAHHCSDAGKFIAAALVSLTTMIRLELPHVNVLSKVDLVESHGTLAFNLDFYTDMLDLQYLLPYVHSKPADPSTQEEAEAQGQAEAESEVAPRRERELSKREQRYLRLNEALCDIISDFSLVDFQTLNIQDVESVARVLAVVDKGNGYLLGSHANEVTDSGFFKSLFGQAFSAVPDAERVKDVQDKYMGTPTQEQEQKHK